MIFQSIIAFAKRIEHWAMVGHIWYCNRERQYRYQKQQRHELRLQLEAWKAEMKEVRRANRRAKLDHWKKTILDFWYSILSQCKAQINYYQQRVSKKYHSIINYWKQKYHTKMDHWKQVYQDWLKGWDEELRHPWCPNVFPTHRLDMMNPSKDRLAEPQAFLRNLDYANMNKYFFG